MTTTKHRISDDGQTIVCESSPDADCRLAPTCDSETWGSDGCEEHMDHDTGEGHPAVPGQACWLTSGHINPVMLEETYGPLYEQGPPTIHPGKAVTLEFHGPYEGATWTYAPEPEWVHPLSLDPDERAATHEDRYQHALAIAKLASNGDQETQP